MKSKIFKRIYWPLALIALIIFFWYHIEQDREKDIQFYEKWTQEQFSGVIFDKYVNLEKHAYKTLKIMTDTIVKETIWNADNSGLYASA